MSSSQQLTSARVARVDRTRIVCIANDKTEIAARVPKRLRDDAPVVGDLVELEPSPGTGERIVARILPRRSQIARRAAGRADAPQVLAANVDVALIVTDVDKDYNPARLDRYLALCAEAGVRAIVVLNKADLLVGPAPVPPAESVLASATSGTGLETIRALLPAGATAILLGSSGVGKSTLVNALLHEDRMMTGETRAHDGRGRHTTTHRELVELPWGAWLIDTPGLREVQLWGSAEGAFDDVDELALACKFSDCAHDTEPGCAVRDAVDPARLASWRKLQREAARHAMRKEERAAMGRAGGRIGRDAMRYKRERTRGD